jgi:hypothetical protein
MNQTRAYFTDQPLQLQYHCPLHERRQVIRPTEMEPRARAAMWQQAKQHYGHDRLHLDLWTHGVAANGDSVIYYGKAYELLDVAKLCDISPLAPDITHVTINYDVALPLRRAVINGQRVEAAYQDGTLYYAPLTAE